MSDALVRTVGEMLQTATPALREILSDEELTATSTRVIRQTAGHSISRRDDWPTHRDRDRDV